MAENAPDADSPAGLLKQLIRLRHNSVRGFARFLAGGETATPDEVEAQRRRVERWVGGHHAPSRANAEELATALEVPVGLILAPYLQREQEQRFRRELERIRTGLAAAEERLDGEARRPPAP